MKPLFVFLFFLLGIGFPSHAEFEVLVTIKPIHSWVSFLMAGVGKPILLMRGDQCPHHRVLRPSEARRLQKASLIIWVGPLYETSLAPILETKQAFTLMEVKGLVLYPMREGKTWGTSSPQLDPHIWLDPFNAQVLVRALGEELSEKDPTHAAEYKKNAHALLMRLRTLHHTLGHELRAVQGVPFLVGHDAYQYLEKAYQLKAIGAIGTNHGTSGKKLQEFMKRTADRPRCVFMEPGSHSLAERLATLLKVKKGVLDPLGEELPEGKEHYFHMMTALSHNLRDCLGGGDE